MAISASCPKCQATFNLADELAGRRVKCKKCEHVFTLPKEEPPTVLKAADDDKVSATPPKPRKGSPPPLSKKAKAERSDDRPRRQTSESGSGMFMMLLFFILGGGGLLGCLGCVGVIGWVSLRSSEVKPAGPIAANDKNLDLPIDADKAKKFDKKDAFIDKLDRDLLKDKFDKKDDRPPPDDKRDFAKKDFLDRPAFDLAKQDFKDRPFDKKDIEPPVVPGGSTVVFGADGFYRDENTITDLDGRNRDNKKHKFYVMQVERGRTYQIDMTSGAFDSYLYLADGANRVLAQDDDGGGYPSSRIVHVAKTDGLFRIEATSLGGVSNGRYTLTVRRTGVPIAAPPSELKNGTSVVKANSKIGSYSVTELHLSGLTDAVTPTASACWDVNGQSFYWLQNGREVVRIGVPDLKVNANVTLPAPATQIALCSEGIVALLNTPGEAWVLDPQTLQVRNKFPQTPGRLVAAPASPHVLVWANGFSRLDAKSGQRVPLDSASVPVAATVGIRTMALSPEGKYLCVQGSDYAFHRMRVSDNKLIHEGVLAAISKSPGTISISPDGKRIGFGAITPAAAKKTTDIYAIDNWNVPIASLPIRLRRLALDSGGGIWGESSPGYMRYYANPAAPDPLKDVKIGKIMFVPTHVMAPPRGDGCLVVYQEGTIQRAAWLTR